jgi:cytochrome d ubiquinol oxidase subunit II
MNTAALPLWIAVAGVVLRGSGFAFRKEISRLSLKRAAGATFAFSSLLTPFFMGTVIGAIATGSVPANATHASLSAWTSPTSILIGFLFVAACGYLAAVYLVGEATARNDSRLERYFTRRAQAAAVIAGALSLGTLAELSSSNRALYDRLTGRALPLVILAGLCGLVVVAQLTVNRRTGVRVVAALGVAAVIWGWGVAQYPVLLPGTTVTLSNAGAPESTLVGVIVVFVGAAVLIGPSFALLYTMQGRRLLGPDSEPLSAGPAVSRTTPPQGQPPPEHQGSRPATLSLVALVALIRRRRRR